MKRGHHYQSRNVNELLTHGLLYKNKFEKVYEMDTYLENHNSSKQTQ